MLKSHNLCQIFSEYLPTYNIFKSLDYAYPKDVKDFIITLLYFILFYFISLYYFLFLISPVKFSKLNIVVAV